MTSEHSSDLQSMVTADRFSSGESVLDLHSRDQSAHPATLPEAVIWPESRQEVSEVLKYANKHGNSLEWMKRIKQLFDPNGILNPGKIFPD